MHCKLSKLSRTTSPTKIIKRTKVNTQVFNYPDQNHSLLVKHPLTSIISDPHPLTARIVSPSAFKPSSNSQGLDEAFLVVPDLKPILKNSSEAGSLKSLESSEKKKKKVRFGYVYKRYGC